MHTGGLPGVPFHHELRRVRNRKQCFYSQSVLWRGAGVALPVNHQELESGHVNLNHIFGGRPVEALELLLEIGLLHEGFHGWLTGILQARLGNRQTFLSMAGGGPHEAGVTEAVADGVGDWRGMIEFAPMTPTPSETARAYHSITKHHVFRQARSLGYMDWENQPNPFRRFEGAAEVELPLGGDATGTTWGQAMGADDGAPDALGRGLVQVGRMLELSLGLTAWKEFEGSRWSLRANPSSGNLHPTEAYLIVGNNCPGLPAGVLHYAPQEHVLELRCSLDAQSAQVLGALLPEGGFLVAFTSIHWREAWKYGERALRYCALDTGHAIGSVDYAALCVGANVLPTTGWTDDQLGQILGTDQGAEELADWDREHPEALIAIVPQGSAHEGAGFDLPVDEVLEVLSRGTWHGTPNALSQEYHDWDVIQATADAARRVTGQMPLSADSKAPALSTAARVAATADQKLEPLLRGRRSAYSMRAGIQISLEAFGEMLDATLQRDSIAPWRGWGDEPKAHLLVFVHRVEGLTPGLYLLERNTNHGRRLRDAISKDMIWGLVPGLEEAGFGHLRLSLLRRGNCESMARAVSCQQEIAGDGVFSLGMLCDFSAVVDADASAYRRLFWECGVIGQALYIEAGAQGFSATGIGCYFDDSVHELLGLQNDEWQVMYHFTVGQSIEDERLQTQSAYGHLEGRVE